MSDNKPKTMRDAFIETVYEKMKENDRIFFVTADLGAPALDKLKTDFKDRFINVGIAEQNLINVAVGLGLEGYIVYAYAIAPFITMRPFEQIRQSLSISSQIRPNNVNLIGIGAGLSYDVSGPTHHSLEDLSIMRLMPNFSVFSPSDWVLAKKFVDYSIKYKNPKYLRFDSKPLPTIYEGAEDLNIEKGFYEFLKGDNVCLVSTGYMTHRALNAAKELPGVGVIDVFLLKPANEQSLFEALKKYKYAITLEEGFINNGGLDGLVSKIILDNDADIKLKRMGVDDKYAFELGGRNYLHKLLNLDEEAIIKAVKGFNI
ncbi:MAG: transketolase [Candidatus Wolfebacteria bacterium]|nr:transketolase [Candidatus Wolfebacteria bacterium]